jgi:hypothetical protein
VTVSQHCADPRLHDPMGIDVRFGGGKMPLSLGTVATEAATPLAAVKAAIKETRVLLNIIVEAIWRLW